MRIKTTFLGQKAFISLAASAILLGTSANAQISIDKMAPASAYDAGALPPSQGGLDSSLWQGVSAVRAKKLLENIDGNAQGISRDLIRAALLSGGVPPQAVDNFEREAYVAARLSAVLKLGNLSAFDNLANQSEVNRASPVFAKIFVERALLGGDTKAACAGADNITSERKEPYWAKTRALCHVIRNEMPAAELTADLLARSGHKDAGFFSLLNTLTIPTKTNFAPDIIQTSLDTALARLLLEKGQINYKILPPILAKDIALDMSADSQARLWAVKSAASMLSAAQISSVLGGLSDTPLVDPLPEDFKALSAKVWSTETWDAEIWGGAYLSLKNSTDMAQSAKLAGAILAQADKAGILLEVAEALEIETGFIPADFQAKSGAKTFARAAVLRRDIGALRGLFQGMEADNPLRARIALASDALGNGFLLGELGVDIEARLVGEGPSKVRAVRDSFIAVAMGANLSDKSELILRAEKLKGRALNPTDILVLQAATRRGSKAEVALRAGQMLSGKSLRADALAAILTSMISVGMSDQAGQLAALDILSR